MNVVIDMLKNRNKASYVNGGERRKHRTAGFTMAEMLIVIAIIGVLAAVSFIAVQAHQKSMTQLEYDTIAKEIFVAAQNHLTLAKSENYQDTAALTHNRGTAGDANADKTSKEGEPVAYNNDIYYILQSQALPLTGRAYSTKCSHLAPLNLWREAALSSVTNQMLPVCWMFSTGRMVMTDMTPTYLVTIM